MPDLADVMMFYGNSAWDKDGSPSKALLEDRGAKMREYQHPSTDVPTPAVFQQVAMVSIAEIAEALRDITFAINAPLTESRVMAIGQACVALQKAELRLRSVNRS